MSRFTLLPWIYMVIFAELETFFYADVIHEGNFGSLEKLESSTNPPTFEDTGDRPLDCADVLLSGNKTSGIYTLWPMSRILSFQPVKAYCNMDTEGGGWTVIQRRGQFSRPEDYFFKNWNEYKRGFGKLDKDFWLGNDKIYAFTNQKLYSVRFDLMDYKGTTAYATYDKFWIDDEDHQYCLHIRDYYGDAGDSMTYHDNNKFSTKDRNNDKDPKKDCANTYKGGWWYKDCYEANLNGLYVRSHSNDTGIVWKTFRKFESLQSVEIMIRPYHFGKH